MAAGVKANFIYAALEHDNSSTLNSGFQDKNDKTYVANRDLFNSKVESDDLSEGNWSLEIRRVNAWDR